MLEAADGEFRRIEVFRVRREVHAGAGVALADGADHFKVGGFVAIGKGHLVLVAVTLDLDADQGRQGVDHRNTHAVQTTGELVVLIGELATGVELGEDQLNTRHTLFRVNVHRHATTVVGHFQGVVSVENDMHRFGVPGQGFVDAVVDDFLGEVIRPTGVGVHAGAFAHRVEAREDFDGVGVIRASAGSGHGVSS